VGVIFCLRASANLSAAQKVIKYNASGIFQLISGADGLKLAGAKFTIQASVNAAAVASSTTSDSSTYSPIPISVTVNGSIKLPINSKEASLTIAHPITSADTLTLRFPFALGLLQLTFTSVVSLQQGVLSSSHPAPYALTTIYPSSSTLSYTNGIRTTVLGLTGTTSAAKTKIAKLIFSAPVVAAESIKIPRPIKQPFAFRRQRSCRSKDTTAGSSILVLDLVTLSLFPLNKGSLPSGCRLSRDLQMNLAPIGQAELCRPNHRNV
jgi:hypothetical protein